MIQNKEDAIEALKFIRYEFHGALTANEDYVPGKVNADMAILEDAMRFFGWDGKDYKPQKKMNVSNSNSNDTNRI